MGDSRDTRGQYDRADAVNVEPDAFTRGVDRLFGKIDKGLTALGELTNAASPTRRAVAEAVAPVGRQGAGPTASAAPGSAIAPTTWRVREITDASTGAQVYQVVAQGSRDKGEFSSRQLADRVCALLNGSEAQQVAPGTEAGRGAGTGTGRNVGGRW